MNLNTIDGDTVTVSEVAFGRDFNETLVHQVLHAYIVNGKVGTKAQKTRSEVRGGGRKPWKQKGTGRARAGTRRSPIWVGGGVTFAANPKVTDLKVNKKMYQAAMRSILSELVRQDRVVLVDKLQVESPKTKLVKQRLLDLGLSNVLIVVEEVEENLYLATRNIPHVDLIDVQGVDPVSLVASKKLLITVNALRKLEEKYG